MTLERTFDPVSSLYTAQDDRPPVLGPVNMRALTPYQRALLVTDGTVTKFIEAYTMEPIEIVRLGQGMRPLPTDHRWLEAEAGTPVIERQVLLRGRYSRAVRAFADSLVVPARVSEVVKRDLEMEGGGLGRILVASRAETRRDVLWYGKEPVDEFPEPIRRLASGEFLSRTYRIFAGDRPIMLISEKFPYGPDDAPAHH